MTTTDADGGARHDELIRKVVRVHGLKDPLGAMGQRRTRERIERESFARRGIFVAALAAFATCFGIVAASGHPASNPSEATTPVGVRIDIPSGSTASDPILPVVAPISVSVQRPHTRTRSTP